MFAKAFVLILSLVAFTEGADWNYIRNDAKGPASWTGTCETGTSQSPINIVTNLATTKSHAAWTFSGWNSGLSWTVDNKGYTVQFTDSSESMTTAGGDLGATYKFAQFHFHWGASNSLGSEHTVNGNSYPLEVHCVHYRNDFANLSEAVDSDEADALAALGFFFEIDDDNSEALTDIIEGVENVSSASASGTQMLGAIEDVLTVASDSDYYRYSGGLTTPGCMEIVKWTVFTEPLKISQAQMNKFRAVDTGTNLELYRPVQDINNRVVNLYKDRGSGTGSATSLLASTLLIALTTLL